VIFKTGSKIGADRDKNFIMDTTKENSMSKNLMDTVFKAVALGMGVGVIVLNALDSLTDVTAVTLLGIGLAALAISGLQKSE
jgi:hypothetical protein